MAENRTDATHATEVGGRPATTEVEGFEISPQQRRIWLLQRHTGALYARVTLEFQGALDVEGLQQAVAGITARHEILRTDFRRVPGRIFPVQIVHDDLPPEWQAIDLESLSPQAQSDRVQQFLEKELPSAFCFEKGPLFRVSLLRLNAHTHLLSLCLPALCADTASLRTLAREIAALYAGEQTDSNSDPLQYADLADWQNELLEIESNGEAGRAYWRQYDPGAATVSLPFEKIPDAEEPFHVATVSMPIDSALAERLRVSADSRDVRVAAVLAGCWQALLCRVSGSPDVPILYASEGRPEEDLQGAVGPLARRLPLLVGVDPSVPIGRLWRRVNRAIGDALRWEHYWNWGDTPEEETGQPAKAQFGFQFDEWPDAFAAGSMQITLRERCATVEPLKLELVCLQQPSGISLEFRYDVRRYQAEEIRRLAASYRTFLEEALLSPDAPLGSLSLLPPEERQKVVVEWNRTDRDYPDSVSVHHLFEAAADAHPESLALVYEDEQLTYGELNRRANQLAHSLRRQGVDPDRPVGLYLERSLEMIVGLLGILKAGGAYLPLDPALPRERLQGMLDDSGARLLITRGELPELEGVSLVRLDLEAADIAQQSEANPLSITKGEHLVYVIYTSGSTGRPKGVGIEHRHLVNYVRGVSERLGLPAGASYATVSTIAADLGNTALFPALCGGGCLHVVSAERATDAERWREYFGRHSIDCLKIVPSHLSALLGRGDLDAQMLPRKVLVLGGEASSWELVERIAQAAPALRIFNHYGPTETTVGALTYAVEPGLGSAEVGSMTVPLGRPLPNYQVYLLNSYLQPVPVGTAGEIYIGGAGVGRGYLNQEELTAERFVRDPFRPGTDARLYRTGDLGRHLPAGDIEFLGRIDHQVKIRGYRIELGEIESVLRGHPSVREAIVLAREEAAGDKQLVAYVVGRDGEVSVSALREHLSAKLPGYMVPAALVALLRLPLTANGKIDRAALAALEIVEAAAEYVGPGSALEEVLAGIWEELLPRKRIGVHQNFFDLGGHSLLATQVISQVRETFQVDVPLRTLFDSPTIAAFAAAMLLDTETRAQVERMAEILVSLSGLSEEELESRLSRLDDNGAGTWK